MSIPEGIKQKRPTQFGAVEIRCIGGHYYTYLVSSQWDAVKRRPQKVARKSIGKITDLTPMGSALCSTSILRKMS